MTLILRDIKEQPRVIEKILQTELPKVKEIAEKIKARNPSLIMVLGRGSSNNAVALAKYLFEYFAGIPVAMVAPSVFTSYQAKMNLEKAIMVAVSRSGETPEVLEVLQRVGACGALTVAVTNEVESSIARFSDEVLSARAGTERAVSATKSYLGQVTLLYLLAGAISGDESVAQTIGKVPQMMEEVLELAEPMKEHVRLYRYMTRCAVLGRGVNYATALEVALKLEELCYVSALSHSSGEFLHGPIGVVGEGYPVLIFAPTGPTYLPMLKLVEDLKVSMAEIIAISEGEEILNLVTTPIQMPAALSELYSPLLYIVAGQLFAVRLAQLKGYSPDRPRRRQRVVR